MNRVYQEIANLIDSIHNGEAKNGAGTVADRGECHGLSMGLVAERLSDPISVRGTLLFEKESPFNVFMSSRTTEFAGEDDIVARFKQEMYELHEMFGRVQASQKRLRQSRGRAMTS